ncbi:hypothetical protein QFC22_005216 [Naganishia vaughanmartiniae]|uniref:Uncharacterized protein n=1 Tax=Naganishia vaughanmartiniae TaxID=1424756 RepID=A0ACC2WVI2_9TREE|nr:hypothetical protein QFC22_005216 [Naganishia vaughanmartiniae]
MLQALITAAMLVWNNPKELSEVVGSLIGQFKNKLERGVAFVHAIDTLLDGFIRAERDDVKIEAEKKEIFF